MPVPPTGGRTFHVAPGTAGGDGSKETPFPNLAAAQSAAKPGDAFLLHRGNYDSFAFTVSGEPAAMGYCHCESCRAWSACPVNAFTFWPEGSVAVTQGAEHIGSYYTTEPRYRPVVQ